jgi:hypothetical protein
MPDARRHGRGLPLHRTRRAGRGRRLLMSADVEVSAVLGLLSVCEQGRRHP